MIPTEYLCRDCGFPMRVDKQKQMGEQPDLIVLTCMNKSCSLWSVTLTYDVYAALTEEQVAEYREMVAGLKKRFGY